MEPSLDTVKLGEGGINTIIRAYHTYADQVGLTFVSSIQEADVQ